MRRSRIWWTVVLALLPAAAGGVGAQQRDSVTASADSSVQQQVYESQRAALIKQLQDAQNQLSALRGQRVELEARIDNSMATAMERRARLLLMSSEQNALLQLDTALAVAQESMLAQRDRMQALGDAVRRRAGAVLIVLFRADSATGATPGGVELNVDNAAAASRSYSTIAMDALHQGAVDQLYRSNVLPTTHTVSVTVTAGAGGQPITQALTVNAPGETVTYVQFTMRNGQLVPSTWTSRGTAPF